jgi:hypothetical protein
MNHRERKIRDKPLNCQVCGTSIPSGGIFYIGRTEIISGSDGILPDSEGAGDRIIEMALKEIVKRKNEQELMNEVYQEIRLILCGCCRLSFRETILDMIKF